MVSSFEFSGVPQIVFGPGSIVKLPSVIKKYGRSVLIITGASSFDSSVKGKALLTALESENLLIHRARIEKEPSPDNIDEITEKFFNKDINVIAAIGGGSAMDTGKAVSAMILSGEKVKDYLEGIGSKIHTGLKLPFIAIPTTSGTGSEATNNAVISEIGEKGFKRSLRHDNFVPDYAIVDPELILKCNPEITAASGMDAFSQLLESYLSVEASLFTDSLAVEALRCISICLPEVFNNGSDLKARTGMAYAAMISGITLSNAGLGLVHGFASALGGYMDIPHGIVCGTLMGAVNRRNVEMLCDYDNGNIAFRKYVTAGKIFISDNNRSAEYYAKKFVDYIDELIVTMNLPRLGKYGLKAGQIDKITGATRLKNNPVLLDKADLQNILLSRI